jgi:mono/diheme cytochrome c family protein
VRFKRFVDVVQLVALGAVLLTVALLVLADPDDGASYAAPPGSGPIDGAVLYADLCAACHGDEGEGRTGPALGAGAVVEAFPDRADQIALVSEGRAGMPAFGRRLSEAEIEAVVDYTRDQLGR